MIRSEVGVTGRVAPAADAAPTTCFECLLADRDSLCFFGIA